MKILSSDVIKILINSKIESCESELKADCFNKDLDHESESYKIRNTMINNKLSAYRVLLNDFKIIEQIISD